MREELDYRTEARNAAAIGATMPGDAHSWIALVIGFVVSFVVAYGVVAWFMTWVRRHGFAPFAIYRIVLGIAGVALGLMIGGRFTAALVALWIMGCVYNIRPLRSKDVPYIDVLTEAINNPIRMVAGWYIVTAAIVPPATMLLGYWMVGCYFMAIKRYAEVRQLAEAGKLAAYRRSLAYFTPERMLIAIMFYAAAAMLFFGAFIIRYRLELVLSFPFVALVMAAYLELGFRAESAAQNPEKLYHEPRLMLAVTACTVVMVALMYVDLPFLHALIDPSFLGGVRPAQ